VISIVLHERDAGNGDGCLDESVTGIFRSMYPVLAS
jgi:hypothetical protein